MNEIEVINTIKNIIGTDFIGDDCAYLKDLGIVITQDSLVENIHFKRDWCTPYQLGYKSIIVNISDILASGAEPKYITIALSLPKSIDSNFIEEFYKGASSALNGAKIVGGDITGSDKDIIVSVAAIGSTNSRNISSRANAKEGYIVITKGNHGSSALGLNELLNNKNNYELIKEHLEPKLDINFANRLATSIIEPYAMMDSSNGLADALFKIAEASNVKIISDYNKIPHLDIASYEQVMFGGEDYKLIVAIPEKYKDLFSDASVIGKVVKYDGIRLDVSGHKYSTISELNTFNHF